MAITGLVLQGGGALGAFELGVVECLLDHGIRPDVVSGVSIGAINATVLCGCRHGDPKSALHELWADLTTFSFPLQWAANMNQKMSMFGNPGMYRPRTDYFNIMGWTSFYDTAPLDQTLARNVDFKKLGPANFKLKPKDQAPRLILTATNLLTGRLERFDSRDMQIEPAHVRASGSLPPSFPPTAAPSPDNGAEQLYWDGGLFDNTPLSKVIDALQDSNDSDKTMYVVNLFPNAAPLPDNIPAVVMRMMTVAFSNKAEKDLNPEAAHQTSGLQDIETIRRPHQYRRTHQHQRERGFRFLGLGHWRAAASRVRSSNGQDRETSARSMKARPVLASLRSCTSATDDFDTVWLVEGVYDAA